MVRTWSLHDVGWLIYNNYSPPTLLVSKLASMYELCPWVTYYFGLFCSFFQLRGPVVGSGLTFGSHVAFARRPGGTFRSLWWVLCQVSRAWLSWGYYCGIACNAEPLCPPTAILVARIDVLMLLLGVGSPPCTLSLSQGLVTTSKSFPTSLGSLMLMVSFTCVKIYVLLYNLRSLQYFPLPINKEGIPPHLSMCCLHSGTRFYWLITYDQRHQMNLVNLN